MASKQDRRRDKARTKHKAKRDQARKSRRTRQERSRAGTAVAATWPVADAWISDDWHAWEQRLHAVLWRAHADGTSAWCAFEIDLAHEGLVTCASQVGVTEAHVQTELMNRSSEDKALVSAPHEAVAALVLEAVEVRRAAGHPDPKGLDRALELLGDLDPELSPWSFHFGFEDEDDVTEEVHSRGLLDRLFGVFSGR